MVREAKPPRNLEGQIQEMLEVLKGRGSHGVFEPYMWRCRPQQTYGAVVAGWKFEYVKC